MGRRFALPRLQGVLQAAAELVDEYADGVFFVRLSSVTDPNLVAYAIAHELGIREVVGRPLTESLRDHLHPLRLHFPDTDPLGGQQNRLGPRRRGRLHVRGHKGHARAETPDPESLVKNTTGGLVIHSTKCSATRGVSSLLQGTKSAIIPENNERMARRQLYVLPTHAESEDHAGNE